MTTHQSSSDQDISVAIPIKMSFTAAENYLNKTFGDQIISKPNAEGKEVKYFRILHIELEESDVENYNIEIILNIQTLTTFYNNRTLKISIQALLKMDAGSQRMYIDSYNIDSKGKSWIANQLVETMVNTFIYQKIITKLNFELAPIIEEKLLELNTKLASQLEVKKGISAMGTIDQLTIAHFDIKERTIWIIINIMGWGVIEIDNLDL